jgi:hypothetical protein
MAGLLFAQASPAQAQRADVMDAADAGAGLVARSSEGAFGPLDLAAPGVEPTPDPSASQHFAMPAARIVARGDRVVTLGSLLGWVGLRFGAHRRVDVGVGLPFGLAGVSVDARVVLVQRPRWALSGWALAQISMAPGGSAGELLGFTWAGGGPWWVLGPLASIWSDRGGLHLGAHVGQRALLGGLWGLAHATVELRVVDGVKFLGQGVLLTELRAEQASTVGRLTLLGNGGSRVMPYATLGARLHTRQSAVDVGALVVFSDRALFAYGPVSVWPWLSASHAF